MIEKAIDIVANKVNPLFLRVVENLNNANDSLMKQGYVVSEFSVTLKGVTKLPEIHAKIERIKTA